jgi:hypothetical protein
VHVPVTQVVDAASTSRLQIVAEFSRKGTVNLHRAAPPPASGTRITRMSDHELLSFQVSNQDPPGLYTVPLLDFPLDKLKGVRRNMNPTWNGIDGNGGLVERQMTRHWAPNSLLPSG